MDHVSAETRSRPRIHISAAVFAGLIAGIVFMMMQMAMLSLTGESPWGPPRMMAAIVLGSGVLPPPATFDMGIMAAAMMVHLPLSILFGLIFALVGSRLNLWPAVVVGALFGVALYFVNFYGFSALYPWFADARGIGGIAGHAVFGAVLAFAYKKLAR